MVSTAAAPTAASMAACLSYCPATMYLTQSRVEPIVTTTPWSALLFGSSESNSLIGQPGLLLLLWVSAGQRSKEGETGCHS